jgi:hypothetical protein
MGQRLQWADLGPYKAYLFLVDDDSPINKKVAEVIYDHEANKFISMLFHEQVGSLVDAQIDLPTKVEAMEAALALLVANRFDKAN